MNALPGPGSLGATPRWGRSTLREEAAGEIRRRIFGAELKPGERIDQESVAHDLGVSRVPVREALIALHEEGIVENVAHRGAFVAAISRDDVHDHYRFLGVLSGLAAERAAVNMTAEEIETLRALCEAMEGATRPDEIESLNFELHRRINRGARSRRLLSVLGLMVRTIPGTFFESHSEWPEKAFADHRRIVEALTGRDPVLARAEVEEHFTDAADLAVAYLEARGFWDE